MAWASGISRSGAESGAVGCGHNAALAKWEEEERAVIWPVNGRAWGSGKAFDAHSARYQTDREKARVAGGLSRNGANNAGVGGTAAAVVADA